MFSNWKDARERSNLRYDLRILKLGFLTYNVVFSSTDLWSERPNISWLTLAIQTGLILLSSENHTRSYDAPASALIATRKTSAVSLF